MNKLLLMGIILALFIVLIIVGIINYNSRKSEEINKDSFSFLNQFPYEMQNNETMKYTFIFKIIASLFGGLFAVYGFYLFVMDIPTVSKILPGYISTVLFLIVGLSIYMQFVISLKYYRIHLLVSALSFGLTVINYVTCGIYILTEAHTYSSVLAYFLFVIALALLIVLIVTPLKRWMYLEKEEKDGTTRYYRKKISILPFMEWLFILSNVILVVLLGVF